MEVETVGLTGFLVTMMAVVMRFGGKEVIADQWRDGDCPRTAVAVVAKLVYRAPSLRRCRQAAVDQWYAESK
jgi:hypothetical protein